MKHLAIACVLAAACGGKLPETRYYQLAPPAASPSTPQGKLPALAIEPLDAEPAYDDERIVYRLTPYRLDYYTYHRWSSPPGNLIAEYLERSFEGSGRFGAVTREAGSAPITLGGRVIAIEEVDTSKTKWLGHVVVELRLTDTSTGDVLWTAQFDEREPLRRQSPEGLAEALSSALHRIAMRAVPMVADLAAQTARTRTSPNATASRSGRTKP